jgi:hypothetical protein
MKSETTEKRVIRLESPVVTRKIPMTSRGCDVLRAIRADQIAQYKALHGEDVEIPFPTSMYLALEELAKVKGLVINKK